MIIRVMGEPMPLSIFEAVAPTVCHAPVQFVLGRRMLRMPKSHVHESVWQVLLLCKIVRIIVRVFVAVMVSKFGHELGWRVPDGQWHGLIAAVTHLINRRVDGQIEIGRAR